jgi:hypothetical protein
MGRFASDPGHAPSVAVLAALSDGPGALPQQLPGSAVLQPVVQGLAIHPHLEGQAQLTESIQSFPVDRYPSF